MSMRPDPTFHASPKLAMEAPAEDFAYTLLLSPDFSQPDALAVIDVKPGSPTYSQVVHTVPMPNKGRRVPPLRMECLLIVTVATDRPRVPRTALPDHSGDALFAHVHRGHQAPPDPGADPQDHRTRGDLSQDRLLAAAHGALRAGRHLRQHAGWRREGRHGRTTGHLHHGLRDLRRPRPLGDRARVAGEALRFLVEPAARLHGVERVGVAAAVRERDRPRGSSVEQVWAPPPFLGSAGKAQRADHRPRCQSPDGA